MGAERHRQRQQEWGDEAWKLRVEGWTQQRIADHLGVSQVRVSQILQKTEKRLYAEFVTQAEEIKARQSEQLNHLYDRLTKQFEESCKDDSGNPALLAQAIKALADQRQIWGCNSPEKREISGPDGSAICISVEDARADIQQRLARLAAAEDPAGVLGDTGCESAGETEI